MLPVSLARVLLTNCFSVIPVVVVVLSVMKYSVCTLPTIPYTYPFGFFNISTDRAEVGFIQIFVCGTTGSANTYLSLQQSQFNAYAVVGQTSGWFNDTISYSSLDLTDASTVGADVSPYGLVISSDKNVHVYAVKADRGTTDGYLVFPLTNYSTEFMVAGWLTPSTAVNFFAGLVIASAFDSTCVEIYSVTNDVYRRVLSSFLPTSLMIIEYLVKQTVDTTGYYVNSSKPISVTSGVSCGNVPTGVQFCDHMADQIPPVGELGTVHVVPPIFGRSPNGGYLVRVVGAYPNTLIKWSSTSSVSPASPATLGRGGFVEINVRTATNALMVTCDKPCVVMQYNKGNRAVVGETSNTDPFIMLTTPVDHFSSATCFETASMADLKGAVVDFVNYVSVVAPSATIGSVRLDGQPLTSPTFTSETVAGAYVVMTGMISHGSHSLNMAAGSTGVFAAYLYGHSRYSTQRSAYGYPLVYEMLGSPVGAWLTPTNASVTVNETTVSTTASVPTVGGAFDTSCEQESVISGSAIVYYPNASAPEVSRYPFQFSITFSQTSPTLTQACLDAYKLSLANATIELFRDINFRICNLQMCPYMQSVTSSGVVLSPTNRLFVGVDATTSQLAVAVDLTSGGVPRSVSILVPYVAVLDVDVESFARCRYEVRDLLCQVSSWQQLMRSPPGCPPLSLDNCTTKNPECTIA
jgi:hypothetical protein